MIRTSAEPGTASHVTSRASSGLDRSNAEGATTPPRRETRRASAVRRACGKRAPRTAETVDISDDISKYKHEVQSVTITHPVTGRRALYVNPLITARIEDMPEDDSRAMLDELFAFADDPSIAYEHEWRLGDLMMWDNWCSCHARTDFPVSERRMLRRCTVKGQPLYE